MAPGYDLVIVGMGSGGMVAAEFAAGLDLRVAVVERSRVGGDCLWTGCVPSKALLASAKVAHHMRTADEFGIGSVEPVIDRARVWERIRAVREAIAASDDNPDRFQEAGVDIFYGAARLTGPNEVAVTTDDGAVTRLETRYVLLATGSRPIVPPIEGLAEAGFVTSETLFELTDPPASVNVGGGPVGVEMVQGFTRLGIAATLLQKGPQILRKDDPALVDLLVAKLRGEGADVRVHVTTTKATVEDGQKVVYGTENDRPASWRADEILVAVGRAPNVEGLGLEDVGIATHPRGVVVDNRGRTSVHSVYVCGDVAGRHMFTHSAAYEGVRAVRDIFFPGTGKVVASVPWCTFTDPELAHAGLTEAEARTAYGSGVEVWHQELAHNDRARADGVPEGAIMIVTHKNRIVGAHMLAPAAGEMIHELALAIEQDVKLSELSQFVHVYPTISTSIAQLAGEAAFGKADKLRWLIR